MPYSNLPDEANKIYEKAYNDAIGRGKDKEYSAKAGWTAVKNAGYKKSDSGEWVKEKSAEMLPEFSMRIVKASYGKDNKMRLQLVASDTEKDSYDEQMSLELFRNFILRKDQPIPAAFASLIEEASWKGGDPYLSVAHYKSGEGGKNAPGVVEDSYIDGRYFKSRGVLNDTELGRTVFKAINQDLYGETDNPNKIRVSIAFLDLKHKHGDVMFERRTPDDKCPLCELGAGDKTYLDGYLVHEAFTRVPANPRTAVEVERMADQILTKRDDAKSIVGELADGFEEKSLAGGMVVRDDGGASGSSGMTEDADYGGYLVDVDGKKSLPTTSSGKIDHKLMGAAWAALTSNHRGEPYKGPDKSSALSKLRKLYEREGIPTPTKSEASMAGDVTTEKGLPQPPVRDYETTPDKKVDVPEIGFAASNRASSTEPDFEQGEPAGGVEDGEPGSRVETSNSGSGPVQGLPHIAFNAAVTALKSAIERAQQAASDEDADDVMKSLVQPAFNKLGEEVRKACMRKPPMSEKSGITADQVRSIAAEVMNQVVADQLLPAITELKSMVATRQTQLNTPSITPRRSIQPTQRTMADLPGRIDPTKPQSIHELAARSTGLKQ